MTTVISVLKNAQNQKRVFWVSGDFPKLRTWAYTWIDEYACIGRCPAGSYQHSDGSVVKAIASWVGGRGFDPRPQTKGVIKMVVETSLISDQHVRIGLASLSLNIVQKWDGLHPEWAGERDNYRLG